MEREGKIEGEERERLGEQGVKQNKERERERDKGLEWKIEGKEEG